MTVISVQNDSIVHGTVNKHKCPVFATLCDGLSTGRSDDVTVRTQAVDDRCSYQGDASDSSFFQMSMAQT